MTASQSRPKPPAKKLPLVSSRRSSPQAAAASGYPGFPVVGIGASAGGIEALTSLFKELASALGMAFIVIPHLEPTKDSAVSQILGRATKMPVLEATEGTRVAPNHVYVIPPNHDMTITELTLHLGHRPEPRSTNTTIDIFLRSLAASHGSDAIAVILSGTASDGTLGVSAIKGEGGITFAQEPGSAKYDSMPASAIASGCVDFVLPPAAIAREIARIVRHPYLANGPADPADQLDGDIDKGHIFRLLRRVTRVDFSDYKWPTVGRRIERRMALRQVERLKDYVALLNHEPLEVTALYHDLLISVTSFFRNPLAFEALKHIVYPAIVAAHGPASTPLRVWVPGCATGEEAYSLAISLLEFLAEVHTDIPIQIFGTDLSEGAIQRARAGFYKAAIETDVSAPRLLRFFHKQDGGYQIRKSTRDLCIFSTQNVFNDPPFSRIDLVSCRNVMIYLGQSTQRKVIPSFHYALNPESFLLIGNTEGLLGMGAELFELVDKKNKIYQKRAVPSPIPFGLSINKAEPEAELPETFAFAEKTIEPAKVPMELQREVDRLLLARYAPPAVLISQHLEILQTRGSTGSYLELPSGKASLNLLKMARPGLLFELQGAIDEARQQSFETRREDIRVDSDGKTTLVTIRVIPFKIHTQPQPSFLIVFENASPQENVADASAVSRSTAAPLLSDPNDAEVHSVRQLRQTQQELAATRDYLQSIIESQEETYAELQSANEETQSGNEELQSTNEELQTSKEELESANEELHTMNEEMQHRNELLTQLNNDLTNVLSSVNLPIVMLAADLTLRRFTPQAAEELGLTTNDIGRPLPRLKLRIEMSSLEQNMLDVVRNVEVRLFRVKNSEGKWCILRVVPYRTADNRIEGVVLSVVKEIGTKALTPISPLRIASPAGKLKSKSKTSSRRK